MNSKDLKIIIRRAVADDIPQMCDLLTELFSIEADFGVDRDRQARGLQLLLEEEDRSLVLVAAAGNNVVGMCSVQTLISTSEGSPVGLVEDVVVRDGFRGKGVGTSLLEKIFAWCEENGMTRVQLLADRDNQEALYFYTTHKWTYTNMVCMRKFTSIRGNH